MEWLKLDEEGEIAFVSEEVKLVPEIQNLLSLKYNKQKGDLDGRKRFRALAELRYLYLVYSLRSPYRDYTELERVEEAKKDCSFDNDWEESVELKQLIPKFQKGTESKISRLLKTAENVLDKLDVHFNKINLEERAENGTYVNDPKKIMDSLKQLPSLAATLQELEQQVRQGSVGSPKSKGDHELGWMQGGTSMNEKRQQAEDTN